MVTIKIKNIIEFIIYLRRSINLYVINTIGCLIVYSFFTNTFTDFVV